MEKQEIIDLIETINDQWLTTQPQQKNQGWEASCYFLGCLAAYDVTGRQEYLDCVLQWARSHEFRPFGTAQYAKEVLLDHFTNSGKLPWKYAQHENYRHIHADHILCGRIYMQLLTRFPELKAETSLEYLKETLDFTVQDDHDDYWWWIDAIHMGLCVYHEAAYYWNHAAYAEKGHRLYMNTKQKCYDKKNHLWYRDWRFLPERMLDEEGNKIFWSRGNGWVYAGLAHTLAVLPKGSAYKAEYENTFLEMTESILKCQWTDGFWHPSLLSPRLYDTPETSGTLMFLFGLLKGIRLGLLPPDIYGQNIEKGIRAFLRYAVSSEGKIFYVQGVADRPGAVEKENTRAYAVGYALLMLREWMSLLQDMQV